MKELFYKLISDALRISEKQVSHTIDLLNDGSTIPLLVGIVKKLPVDLMKYR